jgi:tetratricopeptide (TPR) repeat protein
VSVYFFFRAFCLIGREAPAVTSGTRVGGDEVNLKVLLPAGLGALILAFSETFWSQALSIEVYPLHLLFLSVLLFLFLKGIFSDINSGSTRSEDGARKRRGYWFLFAYVLGLSFSNHLTTILLAPAFLYLYFSVNGFSSRTWRRILVMAGTFVLGFSVQLYLVIRSQNGALLNWGNPSSFERFFWHFGGRVYRVWFFSSTESAMKQLTYFIETLPAEFALVPLVIAAAGVWQLFRTSKRIGIFALLLFVGCVGYSINYDIHDIDSYFLLAYVTIGIWIMAGSRFILDRIGNRAGTPVLIACAVVLVGILVYYQYPRVEQRQNTLVETYTRDILDSVEPNGVVISFQWDYFVSASYYLQTVEGVRTDVTVIDKELLRRSWYYEQLRRMHPALMEGIRTEVDLLLKELYKFEHDLPYAGPVIEERYKGVISAIIRTNIGTRKVYVTPEIEPEYTSGFTRYPHGLTFQLAPPGIIPPVAIKDYDVPSVGRSTKYTDGIRSMYAQAYYFTAQYRYMRGERDSALGYLERALEIRPEYREAIFLKRKIVPAGD